MLLTQMFRIGSTKKANHYLYTLYMDSGYATYEWGGFLKILCITAKYMKSRRKIKWGYSS